MDWKRFKKIIIVVLVLINIVFSIYYLNLKLSDSRVSQETRNNVVSVLSRSNIILEDEDFPENRKNYSACYVTRLIDCDSSFAKKIKGNTGVISEKDELFTVNFKPEGKIKLNEKAVIDACVNYMNESGIDSKMYHHKKVKFSDKQAKVRFNLCYDDCLFFDSFIDFYISEKGIIKLEGRNIIRNDGNLRAYEEKLLPVESIIVAVPKDKPSSETIKISNVEFGYYFGKSAGVYVNVLSLPVWKISFEDNTFLYYDARNGNLINI